MQRRKIVLIALAGLVLIGPTSGRADPSCATVPNVIDSVVRNPPDATRPYLVEDLCLGDFYFSDRTTPGSHILGPTALPAPFQCAQWIRTPNDDKNETSLSLLDVTLNAPARIFVGFDDRAINPPDWITTQFTDTGVAIDITEGGSQEYFFVWERSVAAGTVTLGGNKSAGVDFGAIGGSNYIVFALEGATPGDTDGDGILDADDNCPADFNPGQEDDEFDPNVGQNGGSHPQPDGVGRVCDNCPGRGSPYPFPGPTDPLADWSNHNPAQTDVDGDGVGDSCDDDMDGDGILNDVDNCPFTPNPTQTPIAAEIGDACPAQSFPADLLGLDYETPQHFSIETDTVPVRGELRLSFTPPSAANEIEVSAFCNGSDLPVAFSFAAAGDERFPEAVAIKADQTDVVVSPPHLLPDSNDLDLNPPPQPAEGQWIVPFLLFVDYKVLPPIGYDDPAGVSTDLACFVQLHRAPTSTATGVYAVRIEQRVKPSNTKSIFHCPIEADPACQPFESLGAQPEGEYGFFTPAPNEYTLLDSGDPTLGTCTLTNPTSGDLAYAPVGGERGWNCCTWFYTEAVSNVISETGFSTFWEGSIPPDADALPDQDADGVMDRCDNCPSGFANRDQSDIDLDSFGDLCDNCFDVTNSNQLNSDGLEAGDACQCSDVDGNDAVSIRDVAAMSRFSIGFGAGTAFDYDRCRVGIGPFRCTVDGVQAVRQALSGAATPLVESCP